MRIRIIGERERLSGDILQLLLEAEETTSANKGLVLVIAFNYGARDEIARACRRIAQDVAAGKIDPEDISAEMVNERLDTADIPDPDLIIRTSGEERLSNFLLWQAAYSELVFVPELWPDFDRNVFRNALDTFAARDRRFGAWRVRRRPLALHERGTSAPDFVCYRTRYRGPCRDLVRWDLFRAVGRGHRIAVYYEWTRITDARNLDPEAFWSGWLAMALIAIDILAEQGMDAWNEYLWTGVALLVIYSLIRAKNRWNPAGVVYAGLTGVSLSEIRGDDFTGFIAMIFIFAVVWGTDIAAYFTGRAIGGKKLAPSISPGKTWSGAIGGAVAAVICGAIVVLSYMKNVSLWIILLALVLSVLSQIGDLFDRS